MIRDKIVALINLEILTFRLVFVNNNGVKIC
jgi:hypothetical protein